MSFFFLNVLGHELQKLQKSKFAGRHPTFFWPKVFLLHIS